jgi:hypothetical protein
LVIAMSFVSGKDLPAITLVLDVAIHSNAGPVSAKALAARNVGQPWWSAGRDYGQAGERTDARSAGPEQAEGFDACARSID